MTGSSGAAMVPERSSCFLVFGLHVVLAVITMDFAHATGNSRRSL